MDMVEDKMKIAVLSGKGGTGKTFVSVNLAAAAKKATYVDCDVEEPNGHLFFKPSNWIAKDVSVEIPIVNQEVCIGCKECVDFCKFNALAYVKNKMIIFDEICHSCGGCYGICSVNALSEKEKIVGSVCSGFSESVTVYSGIMNIGEASGVPIIKALNKMVEASDELTIIDCPPGSSCLVMESIEKADYCLLIAEPTIFGAHNFEMVYDLVHLFHKPFGVVLNKYFDDNNPIEQFCNEKGIKILDKIPFDNPLGVLNSEGRICVREEGRYRKRFEALLDQITEEARSETVTCS